MNYAEENAVYRVLRFDDSLCTGCHVEYVEQYLNFYHQKSRPLNFLCYDIKKSFVGIPIIISSLVGPYTMQFHESVYVYANPCRSLWTPVNISVFTKSTRQSVTVARFNTRIHILSAPKIFEKTAYLTHTPIHSMR